MECNCTNLHCNRNVTHPNIVGMASFKHQSAAARPSARPGPGMARWQSLSGLLLWNRTDLLPSLTCIHVLRDVLHCRISALQHQQKQNVQLSCVITRVEEPAKVEEPQGLLHGLPAGRSRCVVSHSEQQQWPLLSALCLWPQCVCCSVSSSSRLTCACCVGSIKGSDDKGTRYFQLPGSRTSKLGGRTCAPLVMCTWMPRMARSF